ncbi:amidohydrolase [Enemella evansiae]|uniref:Amidohydrolase n=1 Tax=Enemella evansiae TaxID=2016499 RepID=A0A255G3Z5_9ACTN|nr:amidohydrolase family protein [Enemella evansiae]OYO10648.1 amidohydrolase [Enemella evansiae]
MTVESVASTGAGFVLTGVPLLQRPGADALAVIGGRIAWLGPSERAGSLGLPVRHLGDQAGERLLLAPAFVDAHAHVLLTGRGLAGLQMGRKESAAELLGALAQTVSARPGALVHGQGWDHTHWPEGRPPTMAELDRAAAGAPVFLTRVEMHSALVSSALVDRVPGLADADGFDPGGWINRDAFALASQSIAGMFTDDQRREQVALALGQAARNGIGSVQEMSAPHINTLAELDLTRQVAAGLGVRLPAWWGELATPELLDWARAEGLVGLGGDLNLDGAIGSRTACVTGGYHDHGSSGFLYLDTETATRHIVDCTAAGLQAGFHCIGDTGVTTAAHAVAAAADQLGVDRIRAMRPRLEHAEMTSDRAIALMARNGAVASMQPMFEAWWGGPGGLYEQRLGVDRAPMNRFASLHRAGVPLAFGSDTPVTPFSGWEVVSAAGQHWVAGERLPVAEAFAATTVGGHRAVRQADRGLLEVGQAADLALWVLPEPLVDGWPELSAYAPLPTCLATLVDGVPVFDERGLFAEVSR